MGTLIQFVLIFSLLFHSFSAGSKGLTSIHRVELKGESMREKKKTEQESSQKKKKKNPKKESLINVKIQSILE